MQSIPKEINEYIIHFTGSANIPEELKLGNNYEITLNADTYSLKAKDRQDGSIDIYYSLKLITASIKTDKGEIIAKDKRHYSQKLRGAIYAMQSSEGIVINEEEFYNKSMQYLINNLPQILRWGKII